MRVWRWRPIRVRTTTWEGGVIGSFRAKSEGVDDKGIDKGEANAIT